MSSTISVIIPVFNEERTIQGVIDVVRSWKMTGEIIVINDGSTDKTLEKLKSYNGSIKIISYDHNRGKGHAMGLGIEKSNAKVLMFLDGDIIGLTHHDLKKLAFPVLTNKADMTLGMVRFFRFSSLGPAKEITGQRVILKRNIMRYIGEIKRAGYGVELLFNRVHRKKRVVIVSLPTVYIVDKFRKLPFSDALQLYVKEWTEVILHLFKYSNGKFPG